MKKNYEAIAAYYFGLGPKRINYRIRALVLKLGVDLIIDLPVGWDLI
jgi:hypothetical protein